MKKFELGRSMVEMLGVLAIIGILSVTGIAGYTMAMRKYRANEIIQSATMLSILATSMDQGEGGCLTLTESNLPQNPGGANVEIVADATVSGAGTSVYVQFKDGDGSLCSFIEDAGYDCNDYHDCS